LILIIQTFLFLFSSLLRLPLTSNLFPYTTLFRNKIVGYATGPRMTARLAVAALEDAVARRGNVNGCIVHSDRGSQGVFNRSSQHLDREVVDGSTTAGGRQGGSSEAPFAGASEVSEAGRGGVLG